MLDVKKIATRESYLLLRKILFKISGGGLLCK